MTSPSASWGHPALWFLATGILFSLWAWRRFSLRRAVQWASATLFVSLLWLAALDGRPRWPVDAFLFSDPLLALVHTLAGRAWVGWLFVSFGFVALAAFMGRVFCSHVCPLGALLDVTDRWIAPTRRAATNAVRFRRMRATRYWVLAVLVGAAIVGVNLLGYVDPIVLLTRFAASLFHPLLLVSERLGLAALRPVASAFDRLPAATHQVPLRSFDGTLGTMALLGAVLGLSRLGARFWCRALCPLGGLLAWIGRWAPFRRQVSDRCDSCRICVASCPVGAIGADGVATDREACIVCLSCVHVCPRGAVKFRFGGGPAPMTDSGLSPGRRAFVGGVAGGAVAGLAFRVDDWFGAELDDSHLDSGKELIRPPGALPERAFLSRCVRCGECFKVCPTNTIQPDWYRAGPEGLWAPRLKLRYASCRQDCNACGLICPTQAIRPLEMEEKRHARIGTATITRERCLAWSRDETCFVCEEECPYGAVRLRNDPGHRANVPIVDPTRCNGCGRCEDRCPVEGAAAIAVVADGQIRLASGSFQLAASERGLVFEPKRPGAQGRD